MMEQRQHGPRADEATHLDRLCEQGKALMMEGRFAESIDAFEAAIESVPQSPECHLWLGKARSRMGQIESAIQALRMATVLAPEYLEAYTNLGALLLQNEAIDDAVSAFQTCVSLAPQNSAVYLNLGIAYKARGDLDSALSMLQRARDLAPAWAETHYQLGKGLSAVGGLEAAIMTYREAIARQPNRWDIHLSLAVLLLKHGYFREGWQEYEWRFQSGARSLQGPIRSYPTWQGGRFDGRTLLIWGEQGYGDRIQFVRFVSAAKRLGGNVILECDPKLVRLFTTCSGIDKVMRTGENTVKADLQLPLLSLPRVLGTTLEDLPLTIPYLFPPSDDPPELNAILVPYKDQFKIGVVWTGNPKHAMNTSRSCTPAHFILLHQVPGVHLFSLQVSDVEAASSHLETSGITPLSSLLDDFASTAAVVRQMDLIITVDTALAHLAGALGKPVWTLLPHRAEWRWMTERLDSPWYPTMHLFRQPHPGDWQSVFAQLRKALEKLVRR
jgi:Flp pilus assembly protein TadD